MNHSTPGLPVHHQLPEFTQTHAHRVSDAIQPSHPLSSFSPPAPNLSQRQGLFQWVNSSHEVAKVLEFQHTLTKWVQTPALPLTSTVTLGNKALNLSDPQFQHRENSLKGLLGGLSERNLYKVLLAQFFVCNKHSIQTTCCYYCPHDTDICDRPHGYKASGK